MPPDGLRVGRGGGWGAGGGHSERWQGRHFCRRGWPWNPHQSCSRVARAPLRVYEPLRRVRLCYSGIPYATEQGNGGDVRCVVTQEGVPSLGRRSTSLDHVLRDARLSDLEAELEQLAMDARRTPQRIFRAHPAAQRTHLLGDLRSAPKGAGFPPPVPAKADPMPAHEGLGPDDRDDLEDRWKPSIQLDQEQAIPGREAHPTTHLPPQYPQLTSEHRVLCFKPALRLEGGDQQRQQEGEKRDHSARTL